MTLKSLQVVLFFFSFLSVLFPKWTCSTSMAQEGDLCLTFIPIEKLCTLDKIRSGSWMIFLSSYQGFLCRSENTEPWGSSWFQRF